MNIDFRTLAKDAYAVPLDGGFEMDVITHNHFTTYSVWAPLGKRFVSNGIHLQSGIWTAAEVREVIAEPLETCADYFGTPDECEDTSVCTGEE